VKNENTSKITSELQAVSTPAYLLSQHTFLYFINRLTPLTKFLYTDIILPLYSFFTFSTIKIINLRRVVLWEAVKKEKTKSRFEKKER